MRSRLGGQRIDLDAAQLEHHRGEQPDLPGSEDERPPGFQTWSRCWARNAWSIALAQTLAGSDKHAEMLEVLRHLHDVFGVVDEGLGQITVAEVDPALVIHLFAGDVVPADDVEQRPARPADGAGDVVARPHFGHFVPDLDDLPEALVPDHEMLAARRRVAIKSLVDLAISGIDTDLEDLDQHGPPFGNPADVRMGLVGQLRARNISQVDAVRFAR